MIKGAIIFAAGAAAGLAVGTINGLIMGFKVADTLNKVSVGKATTEPDVHPQGTWIADDAGTGTRVTAVQD